MRGYLFWRFLCLSKQSTLSYSKNLTAYIYGDKERLSQLLTILVDNSIKCTPNGGTVIVTLSSEDGESGSLFRISVKDTGVGIKEEHQQQIRKPLKRHDRVI